MARQNKIEEFPFSLTILLPLPTHRLAYAAIRSLKVDAELSPLVQRSFSLTSESRQPSNSANRPASEVTDDGVHGNVTTTTVNGSVTLEGAQDSTENLTVLRTEYRAATNRMLRVAVNGFMESLGVVLGVMQELDVDVVAEKD